MPIRRTIEMRYPNQEEYSYLHIDCAPLFDTTYFNVSTIRQLKKGKQITFKVHYYYYEGKIKKDKTIEVQCVVKDVDTVSFAICQYCGNDIERGSKKTNFQDREYVVRKSAWKQWEARWYDK